jgi:hypothetical protein
MPMSDDDMPAPTPGLRVYRGAEARDYAEHDVMELADITPVVADGLASFATAGAGAGQQVKLLFGAPGFSLTYVWFKSGYPLPLHSHNADCLYYIIAGSVRIGREELGPGDGFFVGCDVPYTYVPGPEGVQVLEFRNTDHFHIRFLSNAKSAWEKTVAKLKAQRETWESEPPPTRIAALAE